MRFELQLQKDAKVEVETVAPNPSRSNQPPEEAQQKHSEEELLRTRSCRVAVGKFYDPPFLLPQND
jgi:hypothetical protein